MAIKRKFNMFSTREWILYLQYKLSPDREKELNLHAEEDDFLRESIEIIGDKENRPLAYQSISQLINAIAASTGVSESKIIKDKVGDADMDTSPSSSLSMKWILGAVLGLVLLTLISYGIYYFGTEYDFPMQDEDTGESMIEAESVSETQLYADSSTMPMETLPTTEPTTSPETNSSIMHSSQEIQNTSNPASANTSNSTNQGTSHIRNSGPTQSVQATSQEDTGASNSSSNNLSVPATSKERDLFNKAQDLYKDGDREGAKKILRDLKSYENPMQSKAENILQNMEN